MAVHAAGWRRLAGAAAILAGLWICGLIWFVAASLGLHGDPRTPTDAIVVLTGGKQRLETGLALLAGGKGNKLFISGVNPQVDRASLLHALGPSAEQEMCCIMLGREADNTVENAAETAGWMRREGYTSLRLVTGWYHMRRALLEFGRAMPQTAIIPHPVFAARLDPESWWGWHGAALLVVGEYGKYLFASVRPLLDPILPPGAMPGDRRDARIERFRMASAAAAAQTPQKR